MKITGGCIAPRTGKYELAFITDETGHRHRQGPPVSLNAGDVFPGGTDLQYEEGDLHSGEIVPVAGVWFGTQSGGEVTLKAGDTFPEGNESGVFLFVREG